MTKTECPISGLRHLCRFGFRYSDLIGRSPIGCRHLGKIEACTASETLK
jgi:hypothetical protein